MLRDDLPPRWICHAVYGLLVAGREASRLGDVAPRDLADLVLSTFLDGGGRVMTTSPSPAPPTPRRPAHPLVRRSPCWRSSLLVVVIDMTVLNVALPDMVDDLGLSSVSQLWVVDVYALVLAGLLIPITVARRPLGSQAHAR